MFQKDGSSTIGGKKDAPLRKSDRRRLRDRVLDILFVGGECGTDNADDTTESSSSSWIARAERLVDDAIVAPRGGDVLSRKLRLSPGGEHATLFLRAPSSSSAMDSSSATINDNADDDDNLVFPAAWPYRRSTQPILLEYEDGADRRKMHLVPLVALLAALPPPSPVPSLAGNEAGGSDDDDESKRRYRIPNIAVHAQVSKYLCRGADLMRSGIHGFPPPWELRQSKGLVSISVAGNPQVVAVGTVERTLFREYCYSKNNGHGGGGLGAAARDWRAEAANFVGPGMKGVGVAIANCYGDDLWRGGLPPSSSSSSRGNFGDRAVARGVVNPAGGGEYDDGNYGNVGFVDGKFVCPILDGGRDVVKGDVTDEIEDGDDGDANDEDATSDMERLNLAPEGGNAPARNAANVDQKKDENATEDQKAEGPREPDHDDILLNAFYASLLGLLATKAQLPMPVSTYYAKHLLAAIPSSGPRLDMKRTGHKKIGSFLREMELEGVVRLGASKDGKDRCAFLAGISKNDPELVRFKRSRKREIDAGGGGGDASSMAGGGGASGSRETKLAVVDLFIVPHHVSKLLRLDEDAVAAATAKTEERRGTGFLTKAECRALIEGYIEREEIMADPTNGGKGRVMLDGPLCDALYRASKKSTKQTAGGQSNATEYPTSVKRKELVERWMERMDSGYAVVQMPGSKILQLGRGAPKKVDIEVEFRQGNKRKFLTRLRGMEEYGVDDVVALSKDVSHRFACSASIETDAPTGRPALKKGRAELTFGGHLSEELTALLTGDETLTSHGGVKGGGYNLPRSVIDITLRKGVPARKKR